MNIYLSYVIFLTFYKRIDDEVDKEILHLESLQAASS